MAAPEVECLSSKSKA